MATDLIQVLKRKLVAYEGAGMTEQAKAVKAKLAAEEKAAAKAETKAAKSDVAETVDEPADKPKKEKT